MIRVGQMNTLDVHRQVRGGWELCDEDDRVFLPEEQAPWDLVVGVEVEVFVYTDGQHERIATTQRPLGMVGDFVCLEVVDVSGPGAFCDWGLDKDLLIPHSQMHTPLDVGDRVVVAITVDRYGRIMGESWLRGHFQTDTERVTIGQAVDLLVYGYSDRGVLAVVDGRWAGMLFYDQTHRDLDIGEALPGYVTAIRDDGRLDVQLDPPRDKRTRMSDELTHLCTEIRSCGGFLPLTDRSDPDHIRSQVHMSKKAFKRAVGGLYKAKKIRIEPDGIRWIADS